MFRKSKRNGKIDRTPPRPLQQNDNREPLIRLRNVTKHYRTAAGEFPALKGINLDIYPGEFVGVIGKSGAGKSTLVNMLTGVDHLTEGEVWIEDTPVHQLSEDEMALWRGLNVGVVYQSFQLMPMLSLIDNVMLPMDFCGLYRPGKSYERAMDLLTRVELAEHANKPPTLISGGQQQRVAIARALANEPHVIVADEPTGNLDSVTAETIYQLFDDLVAGGTTVIIVTHDNNLSRRLSHTLRIADGKITEESRGDAQWGEQEH